jgi:hypothetical protein
MYVALSTGSPERRERAFFAAAALFTALLMAVGFGSFALSGHVKQPVPPLVLIHGVLFAVWIGIVIAQSVLIQQNQLRLHRRLGWAALVLVLAIVGLGSIVTMDCVRLGRVPQPFPVNVFLALNFLDFAVFFGLIAAAIVIRKQSDWHRRLMFGAMAALVGPAIGRIGVLTDLGPELAFVILGLKFAYVAVAAACDLNLKGRIHPAYYWTLVVLMAGGLGVPLLAGTQMIETLAQSLMSQG